MNAAAGWKPGRRRTADAKLIGLPSLLEWLVSPSAARGISFAADDSWRHVPYAELARGIARRANGMTARGIGAGDVVNIVLPNGPEFVEVFVATLVCGAAASPIAPPAAFTGTAAYGDHVAAIVKAARPRLVVSATEDVEALSAATGFPHDSSTVAVCTSDDLDGATEIVWPRHRDRDALALLQFTSGSSGAPKGVPIGWDQIDANIESTVRWMNWTAEDVSVSWMPMHHDFGLVGALVTSLALACDLRMMTPQQFIRDPARWLECFGRGDGTIASTASFGLAHVVRRCRPERLAGMDFSGLKQLAIGGERIDAGVLHRFLQLLSPYGLRTAALGPAYGLAEATLGVSGTPFGEPPKVLQVEWSRMVEGQPAPIVAEHDLRAPLAPPGGALVTCGPPVANVEVEIRAADQKVLPAGHIGEIVVTGPNVAHGYHRTSDQATFADGRLFTGDTGFLHEGRVVVLGRSGDSLKVLGRTVFAEELEAVLSSVPTVPAGRTAVLLGTHAGTEMVVLVAESDPAEWLEQCIGRLRVAVGPTKIDVVLGPPGTILRTTSGKPRRRAMWQRFTSAAVDSRPELD